jgi:hypothetical protein
LLVNVRGRMDKAAFEAAWKGMGNEKPPEWLN